MPVGLGSSLGICQGVPVTHGPGAAPLRRRGLLVRMLSQSTAGHVALGATSRFRGNFPLKSPLAAKLVVLV